MRMLGAFQSRNTTVRGGVAQIFSKKLCVTGCDPYDNFDIIIIMKLLINIPWTILGFLAGLMCLVYKIKLDKRGFILIFVKRLWVTEIFLKRRTYGLTLGNIIILSQYADEKTLIHEIKHVEQFRKMLLIFPILYLYENYKYGYKNNKFEIEANK